jgi:hypothetical protein
MSGLRAQLADGAGWLPPEARLTGREEMTIIDSSSVHSPEEARAYAKGWFARAFQGGMWCVVLAQEPQLDPTDDADLLRHLADRPPGSWAAYGVEWRPAPEPEALWP